jgi:hypothetical protein
MTFVLFTTRIGNRPFLRNIVGMYAGLQREIGLQYSFYYRHPANCLSAFHSNNSGFRLG